MSERERERERVTLVSFLALNFFPDRWGCVREEKGGGGERRVGGEREERPWRVFQLVGFFQGPL